MQGLNTTQGSFSDLLSQAFSFIHENLLDFKTYNQYINVPLKRLF